MRSVRSALTVLVLGFVMAAGGDVQAQVLPFDEMTPDRIQSPILGTVVCSSGTGFRFSSDHFHVIGPDFGPLFSSSGTTHLGFESGRGYPILMEREGTGTFALRALDAGEFYSAHDPERPDAEWITLTGYQADGGTVTHSLVLDGIRDGVGGLPDFQPFVLPDTFVNLRAVTFAGWRQGNEPGGLAIDNLEYQFDPPEQLPPCTYHTLPSDTPVVSFLSPSAGVVSGTIAIEAEATDNTAVASVLFKLDGVDLGAPLAEAPYRTGLDTMTLADGAHTLTAEARDAASNVGTASLSITIQNGIVASDGPHFVELDGADDYLLVGDAPALGFGNGTADTPFTFEMWVRPDAVQGRHQLLGKGREYRLMILYGTVFLELRDDSSQALATAVTNGVDLSALVGGWHHVAVTYDGRGGAAAANGVTIYIDGLAAPVWRFTDAGYVAMENLTGPVTIGSEGESWNAFDGGLDELRMWNVLRTPSQLQATMGVELAGTEAGLVASWRLNEGVGWSASDDTANGVTAALLNGVQWAPDGPLAPDTTAPQIAGVAVSDVTPSSATITFSTNESAIGWVSYAAGTACPCSDVYSAGGGMAHSVTLTGLTPDTPYRVEAKARDHANNLQVSEGLTFRTLVPSSDTQPPAVALLSPATGTVSGSVAVEASASDDVGVVSVQFTVDGLELGAADGTAPYGVQWDTTTLPDGAHTLTARARDAADNVATASISVTVQNGVVVSGGPHHVELDGADDSIRVTDAPALSFGTGAADAPFTLEMWLRPDAVQGRHQLLGKSGEYRVAIIYGTVLVELRDEVSHALATVSTNGVDLSALVGGWHHLAITYDGRGGSSAANGLTIYIDGLPAPVWRSTDGSYAAMQDLPAALVIGHESDGWNQFGGGLDELRVWHVARTRSQLQAAAGAELAGTEPGLAAYWRFNEGAGTSAADGSAGHATAALRNGTSWAADGPLAPDTAAPQIANVAVSELTASSARITFTTDEATTGWVSYAAGTACPCADVYSAGPGTAHGVTLAGLAADTAYRFEVKATDAAANLTVSSPMTFRTAAAPSDTHAPAVTIVNPTAATVSGSIFLEATASDDVGVVSVEFKLDGVPLGAADSASPYTLQWDTSTASEGAHTLTAEARDGANNVGTTSVELMVQNTAAGVAPHYVGFDGIDDYGRVADAPALSFGDGTSDGSMTLEMWLRPDAVMGRHQLIGKSGEYRVAIIYGTFRVDLRDESTQALASAFTDGVDLSALAGEWHHVAVTYDGRGGPAAGDGITIYVDGVPVRVWRTTDGSYAAMENLAAPLAIAHEDHGWNQYAGGLDELRVWNVLRTQSEIQAAMGAELAGTEAGLVGYWRFNAGVGTTVVDDSPSSHMATLPTAALWVPGGPFDE